MSGTAERKAIQSLARRRRWFLTPSARKGTRVNSACAYGASRDCKSSTCHQRPRARMRSRGRLASPLAVRADNYEIHPQKRAEDHRKIGATLSGITGQTSVSLCVLLWMHCRFARRQNMRRIENYHNVTPTRRRFVRGVPLLGNRRSIDRTCQMMPAADGQAVRGLESFRRSTHVTVFAPTGRLLSPYGAARVRFTTTMTKR